MSDSTYVIVGASLAGAKAAEGLRSAGFDGAVVLVGDEPDRPYERPPLSKGYLIGKDPREKIFVHDEGWYAENRVELRLGAAATGLHRRDRQVELAGGDRIGYDKLLIATGSSPRRLQVPGAELTGIHYLRRVGDSEAIRAAVTDAGPVVIVGGGWIGLEVAAAARQHGAEVTLVEPQPTPLYGVLGRGVGEIFASVQRANGVDVRTGAGLRGFEGDGGRVTGVTLTSGDTLPAGAVVVGVGIAPNTSIAEAAGLAIDNGITVDEMLRTSDPAIYAAGDVANAYNPLLDARMRLEHWANATNQGKAAGRSMAGAGEPYAKLPYFFSDQFDLGMEYHGWVGPDGAEDVVLRGEPSSGEWLAFWCSGGRVLAGMNVNIWDQSDDIKRLARERAVVDRDRLADPDVALADLVGAGP